HRQRRELVDRDPVAASRAARPQRDALGLGRESILRQAAAGVMTLEVVFAQGRGVAPVLARDALVGNQQAVGTGVAGDRFDHAQRAVLAGVTERTGVVAAWPSLLIEHDPVPAHA